MTADPEHLIAAARRLDLHDPVGAMDALCLVSQPGNYAAVTMGLWQATLRQIDGVAAGRPTTVALLDKIRGHLTADEPAEPWAALAAWNRVTRTGGMQELALPLSQALVGVIEQIPMHERDALFVALMAQGRPEMVLRLWRKVLETGAQPPMDGWQTHTLLAAARALAPADPVGHLATVLEASGRADFAPLLQALAVAVGQGTPLDIAAALAKVSDPVQRDIVVAYLVRAPATAARYLDLTTMIAQVDEGASRTGDSRTRAFMHLRAAVAAQDHARAVALSEPLLASADCHLDAVGLRAAAQLGLGRLQEAAAGAAYLRTAPDLAWYDRSRGAALAAMVRLQRDAIQPFPAAALPAAGPGRPLVQTLWIGPRLRWIERTALRSWLLNGWRVQLFVYDPPDGIPDGVEVMDASTVLPRSSVFTEGTHSGRHSGSLGAFSDRFRYALLARRGGFWSDTDIINLHRFEPDGLRLVATEAANVGMDTLNGAWLAAPSGDSLIGLLQARADVMVRDGCNSFGSIGPQLLCEMMAEHGPCGFNLLETAVIHPLSWSETRRWFDPADAVASDSRLAGAAGLHVFTETWRQIGVDMDAPPPPDSFIGRAVARIAAAPLPDPGGPPDAVRGLLGLPPC